MPSATFAAPFFKIPAIFDSNINEKRPSPFLFLLEGRAVFEWVSTALVMPLLARSLPLGDGHPVLVVPGFMTSDLSTAVLRRFLTKQGYKVYGWDQGFNWGPKADLLDGLRAKLEQLHKEHGQKISMIGWSLGGIYVREMARAMPEKVRQVISLGSPIYGEPSTGTNVWRTFRFLNAHHKVDEHARGSCQPPVPTTSIYTRGDGVVGWGCCVEKAGPIADNIEINMASHSGLVVNPLVLYAIGDRLALKEDKWSHFKPEGLKRLLFPFRASSR